MVTLLLGFSVATNVSNATASNTTNNTTVIGAGDIVLPTIPDIPTLVNQTENFLLNLLRNMTQYLPVNVDYAETVGRNCNIIAYNKDYYSVPGLIIAGAMFLIGVLFCILGKKMYSV